MNPIILDISRYDQPQPTGVEVYANEVLPRLFQRAEKEHVSVLAVSPTEKDIPNNVLLKIISPKRLWTLVGLTFALLTKKIEGKLLFVPSHILPLYLPLASYITIHDVAYKYVPGSYSLFQRTLLHVSTMFAVAFATGIIAVSKHTANDLVKFYNCPLHKLHIIHSGFDATRFRQSFVYDGVKARGLFGLKKNKYLIFIGRIEEKKNIPLLVESFLQATLPADIKLVLIGKPGVGFNSVQDKMSADLQQRVITTGYLDNDTAYSLLQDSMTFVFPSRFEGFGFPVLEAYALGVPVICSSAGALPEVAGDSAIFADTREELIFAIEKVSDKHFDRKATTESAERELGRFSWERCVDQIWHVLNM